MKAQKSRISIDWLTMTKGWNSGKPEETARAMLASLGVVGSGIDIARPFPRNYDRAIGSDLMTASWHPEYQNMRVCLNMTGDQCHKLYDRGRSVGDLIVDAWQGYINFTRIDVALDYFGDASIADLVAAIEADPTCTKAHKLRPYRDIDVQATGSKSNDSGVYIGSQSSHRYICVYNKAIEQGLTDTNWIRIELRNRKEKAGHMADMIVRDGVETAGKAIIRDHTYPDVEWWQDALQGEAIEIPPIGRPETDRVKWLVEVIAPILAGELEQVDSLDDRLYKTYKEILDRATYRLVTDRMASKRVDRGK